MLKSVKPDAQQRSRSARPGLRKTTSQHANATVEITERALDALATLRVAEQPLPSQALGLVVGPGGRVMLVLDMPNDRDCVFTRDETPIFFVASDVVTRFRGRILDRNESSGKARFMLTDPPPDAPRET